MIYDFDGWINIMAYLAMMASVPLVVSCWLVMVLLMRKVKDK
jgi:archaellum biogenesis protein FlaJ (TadC family)